MKKSVRTLFIIALATTTARLAPAQNGPSRPEIEQRLTAMPEQRRTYERFSSWLSALPADERGAGENAQFRQEELLKKYKAWLLQTGSAPTEADNEIATLQKRGGAEVAEFWNRYLVENRAQWLNSEPNAFLVEMVKGRKPGKALDVGMGQGRNTIWLAQQGWDVTGFDPADQAIAVAQAEARRRGLTIHTEVTTMEQFDFRENQWDLILFSYSGCAEMAAKVEQALKPGGILVEEAFHSDALKTMKIGGSICKPAQLLNAYQELRVIRYEEPIAKPDFAPRPTRVVRLAAERPLP